MGLCRVSRSLPGSLGEESLPSGSSICKCLESVRTFCGTITGEAKGRDGQDARERVLGQKARDFVKPESQEYISVSPNKAGALEAWAHLIMAAVSVSLRGLDLESGPSAPTCWVWHSLTPYLSCMETGNVP